MLLKHTVRTLNTARYLKPEQILAMIKIRLLDKVKITDIKINNSAQIKKLNLDIPFIEPEKSLNEEGVFCFIGKSKKYFPLVNWADAEEQLLWQFNLHYFDYINNSAVTTQEAVRLIDSYIKFPQKTPIFFSPYPLSLRLVNWIKFILSRRDSLADPFVDYMAASLAAQGRLLEQRLEKHLLGNHYLKNIKAMIFLGAVLQTKFSSKWLNKAIKLLHQQLEEQFLADGAHFELSPMYHRIALEDLLDIINVLRIAKIPDCSGIIDQTACKASEAICWMKAISFGPQMLPAFFNDTAYGIAPQAASIIKYAQSLGIKVPQVKPKAFSSSGYYILENDHIKLIIDCGLIGPDYNPGHGHCDMLSFELWAYDEPIFINSGVYTYQSGPERSYFRSTRAHNTAWIEEEEQSQIWASFRVGKRARPVNAFVESKEFYGSIRWASGYCHTRKIRLDKNVIFVSDTFFKAEKRKWYVGFIAHPSFTFCESLNEHRFVLSSGKNKIILTGQNLSYEPCEVSFYFGQKQKAIKLISSGAGSAVLESSIEISRIE